MAMWFDGQSKGCSSFLIRTMVCIITGKPYNIVSSYSSRDNKIWSNKKDLTNNVICYLTKEGIAYDKQTP